MSPRHLRRFVSSVVLVFLASAIGNVGCSRTGPPSPSPPTGSGNKNIDLRGVKVNPDKNQDRAFAGVGTWGNSVIFVVLSDLVGGYAGSDYEGSHGKLEGQHVKWKCVTTDGKTGRITINGTEYDLAKGALFLASAKRGEIRVLQLQRDLSKVQPEAESLENWLRADADVEPFFTKGNARE